MGNWPYPCIKGDDIPKTLWMPGAPSQFHMLRTALFFRDAYTLWFHNIATRNPQNRNSGDKRVCVFHLNTGGWAQNPNRLFLRLIGGYILIEKYATLIHDENDCASNSAESQRYRTISDPSWCSLGRWGRSSKNYGLPTCLLLGWLPTLKRLTV